MKNIGFKSDHETARKASVNEGELNYYKQRTMLDIIRVVLIAVLQYSLLLSGALLPSGSLLEF